MRERDLELTIQDLRRLGELLIVKIQYGYDCLAREPDVIWGLDSDIDLFNRLIRKLLCAVKEEKNQSRETDSDGSISEKPSTVAPASESRPDVFFIDSENIDYIKGWKDGFTKAREKYSE